MRGKGDLGRIRKEVGCLLLVKAELMFGSVCKREREPGGNSRELVHDLSANWMRSGYAVGRSSAETSQRSRLCQEAIL